MRARQSIQYNRNMGDKYGFDDLTRVMVAEQCRGQKDAAERAAAIACQTIVAGLKGTRAAGAMQGPADSVRLITKGMVTGLVTADLDFVEASVVLLQHLSDAAEKAGIDPAEMMTWAMEALAEQSAILPADRVNVLEAEVDRNFMGAGSMFSALCNKARKARP